MEEYNGKLIAKQFVIDKLKMLSQMHINTFYREYYYEEKNMSIVPKYMLELDSFDRLKKALEEQETNYYAILQTLKMIV